MPTLISRKRCGELVDRSLWSSAWVSPSHRRLSPRTQNPEPRTQNPAKDLKRGLAGQCSGISPKPN